MTANYLNLSIPAHVRLHYLRQAFAKRSKHSSAQSWRDMRYGKLTYPAGLAQGFNGTGRARVPVWFTCGGFEFPRQWFAYEMEDAPRYVRNNRGWYCGEPGVHGLARGIVAALPHGRFIAGYHMSESGESNWFHDIHDTARDAAIAADSHAESIAEDEREHNERWQAARDLEDKIEESVTRLRECIALRHRECMAYVRDEVRDLVASIRAAREELRTDYADVL